ncbi:MAG: TolC family protein [Chlamydiales bacterium]|nr:TolC family protein [Chlamydiales bacterium]
MRIGLLLLLSIFSVPVGVQGSCCGLPLCPDSKWVGRPNVKPFQPTDCTKDDQGPLNAVDLLDIALTNNPLTEKTWRDARAACWNVGIAKSAYYPTVTGSQILDAQAIYGQAGAALARGRTQSLLSEITITYLLLDWGGRDATVATASHALRSANWTHNRNLQDVMITTLRAYYDYVYANGLVKARESDVEDAEKSFMAADQQYQVGVSSRVDSLQARSNLASAHINLAVAQGRERGTHGQMAAALGWPIDACFEVSMYPENLPMDRIEEQVHCLLDAARDLRPDLDAAYSDYLAARAKIQTEVSAAMPTLTLAGFAQRTTFFDDVQFSGSTQEGQLQLNMPIFAGGLYVSRINKSREVASSIKAAWRVKEINAQLEVWQAYYTYTTAVETLRYTADFLKFAQEAYDAAMEGYQVGANSILDVLTAQTNLSIARAQYLQARTTLMVSIANIAYAVGTL